MCTAALRLFQGGCGVKSGPAVAWATSPLTVLHPQSTSTVWRRQESTFLQPFPSTGTGDTAGSTETAVGPRSPHCRSGAERKGRREREERPSLQRVQMPTSQNVSRDEDTPGRTGPL